MSNYLEEVEKQLVELTERGAHRRPRFRHEVLALAAAVAIVVAVTVAVTTIGSRAHRSVPASHGSGAVTHPTTVPRPSQTGTTTSAVRSSPLPIGGPVPSGFGPSSFTAIGETTWWLLGSAPCTSAPCTSIVRTVDGGRSFVGVPAPHTGNVSQLRFANAMDGFAYAPELWVTHNGGTTWRPVAVPGHVSELAIGGSYVYAIVQTGGGAGSLLRAPIGLDAWKPLPVLGNAYSGLWVHANEVLLETTNFNGSIQNLMISTDNGNSFRGVSVPPSLSCQFEAPTPPVIWAHCATGTLSGTWRSADAGRSFTQVGQGAPEQPNSAAFGAASETTAVVGYRQLYRTTDGGTTWTQVAGSAGITWWQYLGFTDPTHGVAIGYVGTQQASNERLYYTTDGGASYHLVRIG
jgi:photosystem II stability/assembly factor-like uncharacterized protein